VARGLPFVLALLLTCVGRAGTAAPNPSSPSLFSSYDVLPLQLKAPFNQLFDHARTDDTYVVTGTLSYRDGGREVAINGVTISLRGHTSKRESECPFPKLKLQFPAGAAPEGSLLAGLPSLKIGTHCGESTGGTITAKYGRLANEQSPNREAFVYRLLDAVGVPSLKARPARITYVYTDARSGQSPAQDQPLVRNAMLLENSDEAVRRLGANREVGVKAFTDARAQFVVADTARLAFAEALIGNFDWCLKMTPDDTYRCDARDPLWNIVAAASADGHARPMMYDFDVAGIVTGHHSWFKNIFNEAFVASRSHAEIEVLAQLQRTRTLFTRSELDAVRAGFMQRKAEAYRALEKAGLDPASTRTAQAYLDTFFTTIASDEAFYRPVVTKAGANAYANEDRAVICSSNGPIPVGTPVSAPLQTKGSLIQVVLLDALWHWAPPEKCPAVHEGPVWIDADAVSRNFPTK
jgi:hypothetical protein